MRNVLEERHTPHMSLGTVSLTKHVVCSDLHGSYKEHLPPCFDCRLVNNSREHYEFKFNGILAADAKQDEVCTSKVLSMGIPMPAAN